MYILQIKYCLILLLLKEDTWKILPSSTEATKLTENFSGSTSSVGVATGAQPGLEIHLLFNDGLKNIFHIWSSSFGSCIQHEKNT